jgi:acyl-coenzyme A synthetase/AMP-(fatty) acid ligase
MSPKNSLPAFLNLFEKTGCKHIISDHSSSHIVTAVEEALRCRGDSLKIYQPLDLFTVFPQFSNVKDVANIKPFPPTSKPFSMDNPVLYLHSSGSTGYPKPVALREAQMLQWCLSCE